MPYNPIDDFGADPEVRTKKKFGQFRIIVNPIVFETGASYTIKGVLDRDGNPRVFSRGMRPPKDGDTKKVAAHIVMQGKFTNKEGEEYTLIRDTTTWDEEWKNVIRPGLVSTFGKEYKSLANTNKWFFAMVSEIPTGRRYTGNDGVERDSTVWQFEKQFVSLDEAKQAELAYFAGDDPANPTPQVAVNAGANGKVPEAWVGLEDDFAKVITQLKTEYQGKPMPAIRAALAKREEELGATASELLAAMKG